MRIAAFFLVILALAASPAFSDEIKKVRTGGTGWFTRCYFVGFFCRTHQFEVPETLKEGDTLARISDGSDFGSFYVEHISQDLSGRCYLYDAPFRDPEGAVYLGECEVIERAP